jgi:segregation and condensation protein A
MEHAQSSDPAYSVQTEYFSGPLDLLLHLIRKKKMDIMNISITEITQEYLLYLNNKQGINPSIEGEFLMTASTLIYLKSRTLLPKPKLSQDEDDSPEKQFINTLIEYDKIQKISKILKEMEENELLFWSRTKITEDFENIEYDLKEVSSFQLAEVFFSILRKKEKEDHLIVESKEYSIEEKREELLAIIAREGYLNFTEYIKNCKTLLEILVTFFTILEIVKQKFVIAVQKKRFGVISVFKREEETLE